MAALKAEKSPAALSPLSEPQLQEIQENLVRCLDAYDQKGDAGLEAEMERIHPSPALKAVGLTKVPLGEGWPGSHSLVSEKSYLQTTSPASSTPEPSSSPR